MATLKKRPKPVPLTRTAPALPSTLDQLEPVCLDALREGHPLNEVLVQRIDLAGSHIPALSAGASVFEGVNFAGCVIRTLRLKDVRLIHCDLSNTVFRGFEAARVEFIDCRLIGMKAIEARWQDVLAANCDARYVQLSDAVLRTCEFHSSNFNDADFSSSDLEASAFPHSTLCRAELTGSRIHNVDFRGAGIEEIALRAEDAQGAIVTPAQAIQLARLLGVIIR